MHQQRTTERSTKNTKGNISASMRFFLWLLFKVFSLVLAIVFVNIVTPVAVTVGLLRMFETSLARLAVDEDPAIVSSIPLGDPWFRDARTVVVVLSLAILLLAVPFVVEGHVGRVRRKG